MAALNSDGLCGLIRKFRGGARLLALLRQPLPKPAGGPAWQDQGCRPDADIPGNREVADMDTIDQVRQVIAKTLKVPAAELKDDTYLEDLGAESLDVIEIVYELEDKFGIVITFKGDERALLVEAEKDGVKSGEMEFRTVGEIAQVVKRLVDAKAS